MRGLTVEGESRSDRVDVVQNLVDGLQPIVAF
jgi:hypothetical protein